MIKFLYPECLILSFLCLPASLFYLKRVSMLKEIIGSEKIAKSYFNRIKWRTFFFSLAFCFLCVALAVPIYGTHLTSVQKKGASLLFVMDISNSMTIKEGKVSRLSWAKYIANYTVEKYPNIAFGLLLAKGDGILFTPLTFEHDMLKEQITSLSPLLMSAAGTNLEKGVMKALSSFYAERGDFKIILLFTDGGETKGDLMRTVKEIVKNNVFLMIIGVGTYEGGTLDILNEDGKKITKRSVLEEEKLKEVAKLCKGIYILGEDFASIKTLFDVLDGYTVEKEKISFKKEEKNRISEASFLALLFFCLGVAIGTTGFHIRSSNHCNLSSKRRVNHFIRNR